MRGKVAGIAFLSMLAAAAASGEEVINRNILTDETWTAAASPYIIEKTVVEVKNLSTLTIGPGVEVRFQPGRSIETLAGSSIAAVGAPGDSVRFTSNGPSPAAGDWTSVHAYSSPASEFRYCVFTYGQYALKMTASGAPVARSAFRDCTVGAWVVDSDGTISESFFRGCAYGLWIQRAAPLVEETSIAGSGNVGIYCLYDESLPIIWHCNLFDNAGFNVELVGYGDQVTVTALENWWGSPNENTIRGTIRDSEDGVGEGTVDYSDWLTEVPVEAASWGMIKALFRH
jgi:hypothetical protein